MPGARRQMTISKFARGASRALNKDCKSTEACPMRESDLFDIAFPDEVEASRARRIWSVVFVP